MSEDLDKLDVAILAAKAYRKLTDKPLGITGEVGEVLAARLLKLTLKDARQPGYDAVGKDGRRVQIKARIILPGGKGRMGRIPLLR